MALLGLFVLTLVGSVLMLLAPLWRLHEMNRDASMLAAGAVQLSPLVVAIAYLWAVLEPVPPGTGRPQVDQALAIALPLQLVATLVVLRLSGLGWLTRAVYAVLSTFGVIGGVLLYGFFAG